MENQQHGELSHGVNPWDTTGVPKYCYGYVLRSQSWSSVLCWSNAGFTGTTSGPQRWAR